jgi:cytochrome c peroxidase
MAGPSQYWYGFAVNSRAMTNTLKLAFLLVAIGILPIAWNAAARVHEVVGSAENRLGARLFDDDRFCSPKGDLRNSCSSCHMTDQSPEGARAYADFLTRSWVPWRTGDPRRDGLRNAPTIFDVADAPRLHYDGEFTSLEGLARGTLTGRSMGWLPGEKSQAVDHFYAVALADSGHGAEPSYKAQFRAAYNADINGLGPQRVIELAARSLATYMKGLRSGRNTPYDQFISVNKLPAGPERNEKPRVYAARLLERLSTAESGGRLKRVAGFDQQAIDGLKVFMQTEGSAAGNCSACHLPPLFTDFSFHNLGISQAEYDAAHGEGSFAKLIIPEGDRAQRPAARFKETARHDKPGYADLGYWNFVDLNGPDRLPGESAADFLRRMIGAIKTPTLRNLAYSYPYMHNGVYPTLDDVISEIIDMSELSRAGKVRSADPELSRIKINPSNTPALLAFLKTLNDDLDRRYHISPQKR